MMGRRNFIDMLGREITIQYPPKSIVSIVPSQTELLYDLNLENEVTGITKFCIHPESWFRNKTLVGGTKQLHLDKIRSLNPDIIIANKEENEKEQIKELANEFPVWISNIQSVADALQMVRAVGVLTDKEERANSIATDIATGFEALQKAAQPKRVAYLIWRNPWMCAGGDTFINNIIDTIGWTNVLANKNRYPEIDISELNTYDPDIVLLSSEPYPFKDKHIAEIKGALPGVEVILVDGEMFSWYGSRLLKALPYFSELLNSYM
ncbi:MAG TPA: helical backbone metal receptor [Flavipsychrobacter sp.]|nr:helical backbone metal receptor [Flavipsychrobacter sp.]